MHPPARAAALLPDAVRDLAQLRPQHDCPLTHRARHFVQDRERVDERLRDDRERVRGHIGDLRDQRGDVWVRGERVGEGRLADGVDARRRIPSVGENEEREDTYATRCILLVISESMPLGPDCCSSSSHSFAS